MKYLEALEHLDAAAEHLAFKHSRAQPGWRLWVRARGDSHTSQVELQHWEGTADAGSWCSVANVSCSVGHDGGALRLSTYISCTMCGRWSEASPKANGLQKLFEVADMFEEFTAGKAFES